MISININPNIIMTAHIQKRDKLKKDVQAIGAKRLNKREQELFTDFIHHYLANPVPGDSFSAKKEEYFSDIYSLFQHTMATLKNKIHLKIYNPPAKNQTYIDLSCDNMPFTVASMLNVLSDKGIYIYSQQNLIIPVSHEKGKIVALEGTSDKVMIMRFIVEFLSPAEAREFHSAIYNLCLQIKQVTGNWQAMQERIFAVTQEYRYFKGNKLSEKDELKMQFLTWLTTNKCLFLGFGKYNDSAPSKDNSSGSQNKQNEQSTFIGDGLGLCDKSIKYPELEDIMKKVKPQIGINFFKLPIVSMIHRKVYAHAISIGVQRGSKIEEYRFLLLYAFDFFNGSLEDIPYIRESFTEQVERFNLQPNTYKWRMLRYSLACYPRDELLQVLEDDIFNHITERMMEAFSSTSFRSIVYYDKHKLFVNAAILSPREDYGTEARRKFEKLLRSRLRTDVGEFNVLFSEERLARVFLTFPLTKQSPSEIVSEEVEAEIAKIGIGWRYLLRSALMKRFGENKGVHLYKKYVDVFSRAYRDNFDGTQASADLEHVLAVGSGKLAVHVNLIIEETQSYYSFRLFGHATGLSLSRLVHILENAGAEPITSRPYFFSPTGDIQQEVRLLEFRLTMGTNEKICPHEFKQPFEETIAAVYCGLAENDSFNRLAVRAAIPNKDIMLLRSWANYLAQIQGRFSRSYIEDTLCEYSHCALVLVNLFKAKFSPDKDATAAVYRKLSNEFNQHLEEVPSLEQDQILRWSKELISSINRTNFYLASNRKGASITGKELVVRDELSAMNAPPYLSFKLHPAKLSFCEEQQPQYEIFVYSPDFEGVHLRNGPEARGGIRWSDKRAGYRNEIYQLVEAQIIKNAIIVPTGAKGGFYIKNPDKNSQEIYSTFIKALLELTDNYMAGKVSMVKGIRVYDDPDPYLVVAPDKGTADFSDIANDIAKEQGFWLDDAFASSGSSGYSHKDMGITARGAWESVKRNFAELGIDADKDAIEVIGVGDMSGDVFGNGMLLSSNLRLICAFNHRNIFIDPDPNPHASFRERQRLFNTPGSTWQDYKRSAISPGGDVFSRAAKSIKLSNAIKKKFKIKEASISPAKLIKHILSSQADLLWLGGIGTYIKDSNESNNNVGDKLNDGLRINGNELKVKVVGEGANLGATLRGRIEFDRAGGRVATDSNDNSGGVHCSDREVNIKILLSLLQEKGKLTGDVNKKSPAAGKGANKEAAVNKEAAAGIGAAAGIVTGASKQVSPPQDTDAARHQLLKSMTSAVSEAVLEENLAQNLTLSLERHQAKELFPRHQLLITSLDVADKIEFSFEENPGYLTRPQLSILFGLCKTKLKQTLAEHVLIKDPRLVKLLFNYFPSKLANMAGDDITKHFLAERILDVQAVNYMVDNLGLAFWADMTKEELAQLPDYARTFFALDEVFGFIELNQKLSKVAAFYPKIIAELCKCQKAYIRALKYAMQREFYSKGNTDTLKAAVNKARIFKTQVRSAEYLSKNPAAKKLFARAKEHGVDANLIGSFIAVLNGVNILLEAEVSVRSKIDPRMVDNLASILELHFSFDNLIKAAQNMDDKNRWRRITISEITLDIYEQERRILSSLLPTFAQKQKMKQEGTQEAAQEITQEKILDKWSKRNAIIMASYTEAFASINPEEESDLGLLHYLLNLLKKIT